MLSESLKTAEKYFASERYEEARRLFQEVLDELASKNDEHLAPSIAVLHGNIARCFLKLSNPNDAYYNAERFEKLSHHSYKAALLKGLCKTETCEHEEATQNFMASLERCLNNTKAPVMKGDKKVDVKELLADARYSICRCLLSSDRDNSVSSLCKFLRVKNINLEEWIYDPQIMLDDDAFGLLVEALCQKGDTYTLKDIVSDEMQLVDTDISQQEWGSLILSSLQTWFSSGHLWKLQVTLYKLRCAGTEMTDIKDVHGNSLLDVLHNLVMVDMSAPMSDISYLVCLIYSLGITEQNKESTGLTSWYSEYKGNPVMDSLIELVTSGEVKKISELTQMTKDEVEMYILGLLSSTLRGKMPVVLEHMRSISAEDKDELKSIKGNNLAWLTFIRKCYERAGLGLLDLSHSLESLGCPNLGDSVYRVYKRIYLFAGDGMAILRKHQAFDYLHSNYSSIVLQMGEHFEQVFRSEDIHSASPSDTSLDVHQVLLRKLVQVKERKGSHYVSLEYLQFLEFGSSDDNCLLGLLDVLQLSESIVKGKRKYDCIGLLDNTKWLQAERINIEEAVGLSPSRTPRRRRRSSSKKHVKEVLTPEELKNYETDLASLISHQTETVDVTYMPHIESQVAIASSAIQKHIWYISENFEESKSTCSPANSAEDLESANKATVLVVVPTKKGVSYAAHDLSKYLPHMRIGENGAHNDAPKSRKSKAVVHKPGLLKMLQSKDLVVCAEETMRNCIQAKSLHLSDLTMMVFLNQDIFMTGLPRLLIMSYRDDQHKAKAKVLLFSKSIPKSDCRFINTLYATKYEQDLIKAINPNVEYRSLDSSTSGEVDKTRGDFLSDALQLLKAAASEAYGSEGYLSGLCIFNHTDVCEPEIQLRSCLESILPNSLTISDARAAPKGKKKGCDLMVFKEFTVHDLDELDAFNNINLFMTIDDKTCRIIYGNDLKNTPRALLQTSFICNH